MRKIWIILAGILVVGVGLVVATQLPKAPAADESETIKNTVVEFGTKLKNVSLLADQEVVAADMDTHYAAYVSPDLLTLWKNGAESRLGRHTSSPWPDRIEVVEVVAEQDATYTVEGNIIEITNADDPLHGVFAVQPVTLTVEKINGRWMIVASEKGAYSQVPQQETVVGFWECVPHKQGETPTEECMTGIAKDQSDGHLILSFAVYEPQAPEFNPGDKVRATGVVVPANQLSAMQWQKYDIDGVMQVTSIEAVEE